MLLEAHGVPHPNPQVDDPQVDNPPVVTILPISAFVRTLSLAEGGTKGEVNFSKMETEVPGCCTVVEWTNFLKKRFMEVIRS